MSTFEKKKLDFDIETLNWDWKVIEIYKRVKNGQDDSWGEILGLINNFEY